MTDAAKPNICCADLAEAEAILRQWCPKRSLERLETEYQMRQRVQEKRDEIEGDDWDMYASDSNRRKMRELELQRRTVAFLQRGRLRG